MRHFTSVVYIRKPRNSRSVTKPVQELREPFPSRFVCMVFVVSRRGQRAALVAGSEQDAAHQRCHYSSQLAFVSSPSGTKEVFLVNSDGTNQRRLTNNSADDFAINWSPDGSKLLLASMRDGNSELYSMNPDGTGQTRITTNSVSDVPFGWR